MACRPDVAICTGACASCRENSNNRCRVAVAVMGAVALRLGARGVRVAVHGALAAARATEISRAAAIAAVDESSDDTIGVVAAVC